MSGYTRSKGRESIREEIGGSFKDEYREDEERREYEIIVDDLRNNYLSSPPAIDFGMTYINNLPDEQRREVLDDRRILWSAFSTVRDELESGHISNCVLLDNFFFKDRPEWLTMPEMVQAAKNSFGSFLRKGGTEELDEYFWVVDNILCDKESKDFVFATTLGVVDELVSEDNESGSNWLRALGIADIFLKDNRAEVVDFLEPRAVNFIDSRRHGINLKIHEIEHIKKAYPEILERDSVITAGKRQAAYILERAKAGEFQGLEELTSLQSVFSLTDTDLAADEEISRATRGYLVDILSFDPHANHAVDPFFQKCVEIADARKAEVYGGIYKDALLDSLKRLEESALDQEEEAAGPARIADIAIILNAEMLKAEDDNAQEGGENDGKDLGEGKEDEGDEDPGMDSEVKEAFKKAFVSLVGANEQATCKTLDTHFITNSRELLTDEDLHKAKEELLVNALVGETRFESGDKQWLDYFIHTADGQAIQRAVVKAMEIGEEKIIDMVRFVFLRGILSLLPEYIERNISKLEALIVESKDQGDQFLSLREILYKERRGEEGKFVRDLSRIEKDPAIKESAKRHLLRLLESGRTNAKQAHELLFDLWGSKEQNPEENKPDELFVQAARVGGLLRAEEIDCAWSMFEYFDWLVDTFFKEHPEIAGEVLEKKYISSHYHADLQGIKWMYKLLKKVRPGEPVSREMAAASVPLYREVLEDLPNSWHKLNWLEEYIFASHPDVITKEEKEKIIKEAAISTLSKGVFDDAQIIFEKYLSNEAETRRECLRTGLRRLLHSGELSKSKAARTQTWIKEEAPEVLEEIAREKDTLIGMASKVGVMTIGNDGQQYQTREWSTMAKVLTSDEVVQGDKKNEAVDISRIRKEIMAEYEKNNEWVVFKPYKALLSYLGDESEAIIWEYLGQRDRHQMLGPVEAFVRCMNSVEAEGGTSRKDMVQDLFARAGMGSGMQADVWRNIMGKMSVKIWKLLETTSAYPDAEPPLANKADINLLRIQNEIKLHQTPELRKAIADIPKDKPELRAYAAELMKYPTINIEAIVRFIKDPKKFWASRSGAGEDNRVVSALLRELDPSAYPNWSAELSRDAIVEGSYDKLNSFEPIAVEWSEFSSVRSELDFWAVLLESIETPDTAIRRDAFRGLLRDVHTKLEKADPALAEKSDREIDIHAWAAYATSDETLDVSVEWCKAKGEIYAKKAVEYDLKQKLAEPKNQLAVQERYKKGLEARLGKSSLGDDERAQIEGNIRLAAERIQTLNDSITAVMKSVEAQTSTFVSNLEKLKDEKAGNSSEEKKKIVQEFWAQVERTDFKVNVFHLAKQIAGKEFSSMEEFREFTLAHADKRELIARLSGYLDEAEKSDNIDWYQAEVLKPSSVESAIAGTLSATCDAFGSGKKAHFMTNPVCTQFVVRSAKGRPKEWNADHIISQSLMTDNRQLFDKPQDRWDFFTELAGNAGNIAGALAKIGFTGTVEDFLKKYANAEELIVLDSVEVPVNVQKKMTPSDVYKCLQSAFFQIVQKNPRYDKSVRLGTQYSYVKGDSFPHAPNTDVWVAPLAYSDNLGLEQHKDSSIVLRNRDKDAQPGKEIFEGPVNVRPARPQDALSIALMEDIAFRRTGGDRYITGLLAMTRNLNVACLQSAHNEHAPIAYVEEHFDNKGEKGVAGYLIAQTRQNGDIYIDDTATTGEVKGTGTRLLMKLLTEARGDEQLKSKTIRMDCRGTTSALAISKPSSISLLKMMGYSLEGPKHEEVAKQQVDRLFSYSLVPMAA